MIGVIDYGLGNIQAFLNIYKRINIPAQAVATPEAVRAAEKLILPGVGAFDWAMRRLNESGLRDAMEEKVVDGRTPVVGICVGMQMLANRSDEGDLEGLGWIEGDVRRFDDSAFTQKTHLPHMGWNDVQPKNGDGLFKNLESEARFYFLHSYYFAPKNPDHAIAVTDYGGEYASSVRRENVYGVQFHPEKSHQWGIQLLMNFAELS